MKELKGIKSRYDFSLDNRQVVLVVSGLILVLMLSFLMGTLFGLNLTRLGERGKEVAANPPAPAVANPAGTQHVGIVSADSIFSEKAAENPAPPVQPAPEGAPAPAATAANNPNPERAALVQDLESQKLPAATALSPNPAAPAATTPTMAKIGEPKVTLSPVAKPAATPAAAPAAKPAAKETKPAVAAGGYTIQLSSSGDKAEAEKRVKELKGKSYDAYMVQVSIPDKGTFYRIRVGHYKDGAQAGKALKILQTRESNYYEAWITQ